MTSVFEVSTKTRLCLSFSRRDCLVSPLELKVEADREVSELELSEANEKADAPEEELELEERELHRECSEKGDVDLTEIGAARTGPLFISSASTWKSNWSSSESFPMSCWA